MIVTRRTTCSFVVGRAVVCDALVSLMPVGIQRRSGAGRERSAVLRALHAGLVWSGSIASDLCRSRRYSSLRLSC
jgi:hypothetical protein